MTEAFEVKRSNEDGNGTSATTAAVKAGFGRRPNTADVPGSSVRSATVSAFCRSGFGDIPDLIN